MSYCNNCGKKPYRLAMSRHQKGSSGASEWPLRAQIHKRTVKPNLHMFKGKKFCTKCLRLVKTIWNADRLSKEEAKTSVQA